MVGYLVCCSGALACPKSRHTRVQAELSSPGRTLSRASALLCQLCSDVEVKLLTSDAKRDVSEGVAKTPCKSCTKSHMLTVFNRESKYIRTFPAKHDMVMSTCFVLGRVVEATSFSAWLSGAYSHTDITADPVLYEQFINGY